MDVMDAADESFLLELLNSTPIVDGVQVWLNPRLTNECR